MSIPGRRADFARFAFALGAAALVSVAVAAQGPQQPAPPASRCRVDGRVSSGATVLPGAAVVVRIGDVLKAATSTDVDGKYTIFFAPGATYHVSADLTAFARVDRDVTLGVPPCDTTIDFQLTLVPRREGLAPAAAETVAPARGAQPSEAQSPPPQAENSAAPAPAEGRRAGAGRAGGAGGRGRGAAGQAGQRFQTLNVETDANGAAALDAAPPEDNGDLDRLLPAGFSAEAAQGETVAISGSGDAANLDRGALNNRLQAIGQGQFDPATGQFANGFGPEGAQGPGGLGGFGGPGGRGGGRGGPGGFVLGGRGARGQNPYQGTTTYTFGGSALDTPPFQLRPDVPVTQPPFAQNTYGATFGGPLKIPGIYEDTNRRTNFQVNYTGNHSTNVVDQYATVPTAAMRNGNFSGNSIPLIDPTTGQPFSGNQIPTSDMDPSALALLSYIPLPNLAGASQNYHLSTTSLSSSDALSLRFTQNLSATVPQGGRGFGGRGGGFGGRGGAGGRGGQGARGTNIVLSAQLQYRRNENQTVNIFPGLGGQTTNTSIAAPISLNVVRGRSIQNFTVNITHATVESTNAFSGVQNVAGQAGIDYPSAAATSPLNWGVPNVSFSGFTGLRGPSASTRTDNRLTTSYFWTHPIGKHQVRMGGDYRFDASSTQSNANPRGTFTFTGLYASGGAQVAGTTGADFADFLLGLPQQATLQVGGVTHLHGHSFDAYVEDNWQKSPKLTINMGLRYELVLPYTEVNGQMANLDAASGFTAVAPVLAGGTGPFTGAFPNGLINPDINNLGPRVGFAYRLTPSTILRGGYSITYNPGSYATIARQLVAQPPFAQTETVIAPATAPLPLQDILLASTSTTTNNYGVDKNYSLGEIQTWNATVTRNLSPVWAIVVGYTGVKGTDLDLLSAPNRGPAGLLIPSVQPFTWESSDGHSILNSANFQLLKRLSHGFAGNASYTVARSMDDTPSLGSGGTVVAQDPKNLGAEWALSNFDRRQQFTGNLLVELPFGSDRRWLSNGGMLAAVVGGWSATATFTAQSGTPLTIRVLGAASNVAQGTNGALRADYNNATVQVADPSIGQFFNTGAFGVPAPGTFGDSGRNMVTGPGGRQLNGSLVRDVRLGGNRAVTLQINAVNLLNTVQWASVDTYVNSPTFGQVLSVRPMRAVTFSARFRF